MNKFNLKSDAILNKKFQTELSGYSASEIDKYLDLVLDDYRAYEQLVNVQEETIAERTQIALEKDDEIQRLKLELENTKQQLAETAKATKASIYDELQEIKRKLNK